MPTISERAAYGRHVVNAAARVLVSRVRPAGGAAGSVPFNTMFDTAALTAFEPERTELERFDLYLSDAMNAPRLRGQIVFEYGTLLRAVDDWRGRRVLDIGTGRSTLPRWMSRAGATVTTAELGAQAERPAGGFFDRVDRLVARRPGVVRGVSGSMRALPFAEHAFDLASSISVLEHLDTDLPARTFVPYDEQQRRLRESIDEMIRVVRPGGLIYITSECCDYTRATSDSWRGAYYYDDGPPLSAAWPVEDVRRLFYDYVAAHGCTLVGGLAFEPDAIGDPRRWTSRGPYFSGFCLLACKR